MTATATSLARATSCQAPLRAGGFGVQPVMCSQSVGIRTLRAPDGTLLGWCARAGHYERVVQLARRVHGSLNKPGGSRPDGRPSDGSLSPRGSEGSAGDGFDHPALEQDGLRPPPRQRPSGAAGPSIHSTVTRCTCGGIRRADGTCDNADCSHWWGPEGYR